MKRRRMQQIIPALIMTGAAAVPIATTAEILHHAINGATGIQPSGQIAALPPSRPPGSTTAASASGSGSYTGQPVGDPFGTVQAAVTVAGGKITDVRISAPMNGSTSANINQQAIPLLRSETLQAQSAQVNTVSGATYTSQAYAQSLQSALNQARAKGAFQGSSASSSVSALGTSPKHPSISGGGGDD